MKLLSFQRARRLALVVLAIPGLIACQLHPMVETDTRQLLVTLDRQTQSHWLPGGSGRTYHAGKGWPAPLQLQSQVNLLANTFDMTQADVWPIHSLNLHCVVFTVSAGRDLPQLLARIERHPGVVGAQPMNEFTVMTAAPEPSPLPDQPVESHAFYNDPHFGLQYGHHGEHIHALHRYTRGGDVRIAVIDTLADTDHPDLRGQINRQYNYVNGSPLREHHGTAVAGIIGARANNNTGLVGLAPEAGLFVYGACESGSYKSARCNSFNIAKALEQALEDRVQVLNLSLAGPHDPLLAQIIAVAQSRGVITIAATNPKARDNNFPASLAGVIGVTANKPEGQPSQFREWLTDAEKLSTQPGGGYQFFYGSSMSTASVSGLAALMLAQTSVSQTETLLPALIAGDCVAGPEQDNEFLDLLQHSMGCDQTTLASPSQLTRTREL